VLTTEALLDAALDAFAAKGFEGMSVRELARSLGVSHNLIPQRVGSKDELWRAAVEQGFSRLAAELLLAMPDGDGDDVERLRAMVVRFVEVSAARPALLRILQREAASAGPRFDHLVEQYVDPLRVFGADLMARLRSSGRLRTDSVALMYFFMTHGAGGPVMLPAMAARFGYEVEDVLGDVLGLVARAEHARGDTHDEAVLATERRLQVLAHRTARRPRHRDARLPGRPVLHHGAGRAPGGDEGQRPRSTMPHQLHAPTAPPTAEM
jgi:AcrR family transcriptional regulator